MTTLGLICRFQPVHLIHARLLEAAAARCDTLLVGVGSPDRGDLRNPFSYEERAEQLAAVLSGLQVEWRLIPVPDLGHGPRWSAQVEALFGSLERFVSANGYVRKLLEGRYRLVHPLELLGPRARAPISGSEVRRRMAEGDGWEPLVPSAVAQVLRAQGSVERFRRQHGLATLCGEACSGAPQPEESDHVRVG